MLTLIKNGYLIDPASDREGFFDLVIEDDRIKRVDKDIDEDRLRRRQPLPARSIV